jgi:ribulose-5-phosphate 4-epimerase/fuculose-1-phosphate aldolase
MPKHGEAMATSAPTEAKPQVNLDQVKFDICCAARILYRQGMSAANAGHISVAIAPDRMLMNRFGPSFATLCPNDILTLDLHGNIIEDHTAQKNARLNETVELHGVIHRYNPHAICVLHTHPPATVTWSTFRKVPEIYDQESCILAGEVAVVEEDYEGLASGEERTKGAALTLGQKRAVILPNHGAITTGPTVQHALFTMIILEGMVARNLSVLAAARASGLNPTAIKMEVAQQVRIGIAKMNAIEPLWADLLHRLVATDPELFA